MNRKVKLKGHLKEYLQTALLLGIFLAVVNVGIYFLNIFAGICVSGFLVIYLIAMSVLLCRSKPVIVNEFIDFATQYGQVQSRLLKELDLAYVLLDETGKIIWANEAFGHIIHKDKNWHKPISTIFSAVTKEKLGFEHELEMDLVFEEREYNFKLKRVSIQEVFDNSQILDLGESSACLIAGYLYDETDLKRALRQLDEQSLAVGMIYIDNYDEALESVEDVRRSLLMALIDRRINKYLFALDCIVRKTEKDKYFVIMRKSAVLALKESRFDLLEDVKTVNIGNEMAVTVSIGVGLDAPTYAQKCDFARTAIDLALGRGGDQAVVKTPDSIVYYGGKSQQIEKSTRVKARVKANALQEIISSKDRVLVMGHRLSDADAFGAAVGVSCIARTLNKKCYIVINDIISSVKPLVELVREKNEFEEDFIINSSEALEFADSSTVLVVVDVNKPSITECPELIKACRTVVVLDHHRQSSEVIENATLSYVEPYASSTCEMVAEVLQYIAGGSVKIKSNEADCIYSGVMVDTNNFTAKTGVRTFEAAAFLRRCGADVTRVRKMFRDGAAEYKAKAETVSNAEIFRGAYAMGICPTEGLESPTEIGAQAANELLNINGIKASFVATDYNGKVYISARSIDEVNVQVVMERLGGGGHMNIAGAQLADISSEKAISIIKNTVSQMLEEGAI